MTLSKNEAEIARLADIKNPWCIKCTEEHEEFIEYKKDLAFLRELRLKSENPDA